MQRTQARLLSQTATWLFTSILTACSSPSAPAKCEEGTEGCACYPNKTCNEELTCLSKLCVDKSGSSGSKKDGSVSNPGNNSDAGGNPEPGPGEDGGLTPGNGSVPVSSGPGPSPGTSNSSKPQPGSSSVTPGSTTGAPNGGPTPVGVHGKLHVAGTQLTDEHGDPVQLKGVSTMWLNWDDGGYSQSLEGLRYMRDNWNLSVIRAAMGVDADDEDVYLNDPDAMKAKLAKVVDNAIELGVYVIVDWHDHAAHEHLTEATAFFAEVSAQYKDVPNVLYETFNEPLDDISWSTVKAYHESVTAEIRQNTDAVIILGSPHWSQDVDVAAGNPVSGSNLMYTVHFYSCSHGSNERAKAQYAYNSGLPLFVTEWGASHADGGVDGLTCEGEASTWLNWLDNSGISWAAWKLDGCTDSTCFFKNRTVSTDGGWTAADLNGHAPFVIARMQKPSSVGPAPTPSSTPTAAPTTAPTGTGTVEPPDECVPTGTCAAGDGKDCVDGELVDRECAGCAIIQGCTDCCSGLGALGAQTYPSYVEMPELVGSLVQTASSATLSMNFTDYNQVGAITFALTGALPIDPYDVIIGYDAVGDLEGAITVSLENGASGCQYGAVSGGAGYLALNTEPTVCWEDFEFGLGDVRQINVRIDSLSSGTATLTVTSIAW